MAWYEDPYKGGPMVKVKGFPRSLYPPDAAPGKTPSIGGPDVIAYKRTVARAGRWPWQEFDDEFSNNFSHGRSGNVSQSGIAGVQRQQNIDPTGWVGEKTFNTLRSIRCPEGAHEGEMAMDAYSVSLINQAWDLFQGNEPDPGPDPSNKIDLGSIGEGPSVRTYDLTHATGGLPYYPAFDAVWYQGKNVLAPEALECTRTGTASHGYAFYADGDSGLRWWFGHLETSPPVGRRFDRGAVIGRVAYSPDNSPHVHVGINVERLWGSGQQMTHHTNYTHGAPLIGTQLDAGRPL
jgi:hypothetical protein